MSRSLTALAAACAATLALAPTALADGNVNPRDRDARKFVENVSVPNILQHSIALEAIGKLNDDTREVFSPGYQESLDYVVSTLREAGYNPKITPFNYPFWQETQTPTLSMVAPTPKTYRPGNAESDPATVDFITMANSPTKELTAAPVFPVGGIVDPPTPAPSSASGCADADYAGVAGKVALVQRGGCPFVDKWQRAQAAGATAIIIYNEGNGPDRQNPQFVDNQPEPAATIPAVITSYTLGNDFLQAYKKGQNPTVTLKVYGQFTDRFINQVIAETKGGDPDHVVVVGAHLDSVPAGPGINDDGSGTALLLAQAQELASGKYNLRQKIRFGWWGAEENGLVGSTYYAHNLTQKQVDKIDVMLDYDMLASPNYARLVYDGDGDDGTAEAPNPAGPEGSGKVEQVFDDWFRSNGQQSERIPFDGRSDYVGFTDRGIPAGGVFAGAEAPKTVVQQSMYGGIAGAWLDPCYHQICDNLSTVMTGVPPITAEGLEAFATPAEKKAAARAMKGGALKSLKELGSAATYAVWYFAQSKDPFGTKPGGHGKPNKPRRGHRWQGHNNRIRG